MRTPETRDFTCAISEPIDPAKHESVDPAVQLLVEDTSWLERLGAQAIDSEQLVIANTLIASDVRYGSYKGDNPQHIRQQFFDTILGWSDPESPLNKSYTVLLKGQTFPPLDTFVQAQRELDLHNIDSAKLIRHQPLATKFSRQRLQSKIENIEQLGLDATKLINLYPLILCSSAVTIKQRMDKLTSLGINHMQVMTKYPAILTYSYERLQKRILYIDRVAKTLGWEGETTSLINYFPAILGYSHAKLRAHARLFATHSNPNLPINDIAAMTIASLDSHIIALSEDKPYNRSGINAVSRKYKANERKAFAKDLISDTNTLTQMLGEKITTEYLRYKTKA